MMNHHHHPIIIIPFPLFSSSPLPTSYPKEFGIKAVELFFTKGQGIRAMEQPGVT